MFQRLTELKNKMDNGKYPTIKLEDGEDLSELINELASMKNDTFEKFNSLEDTFAYIKDDETREAIIEFIKLAREYYGNPLLDLNGACRLYNEEMNIRGAKVAEAANMIDYYSQDETMSFIAASVFDDEHFGNAITEAEWDYREGLKKDYADEIAFVKIIITNNPNFEAMTYKNKINYIANWLVQLHSKREDSDKISLE